MTGFTIRCSGCTYITLEYEMINRLENNINYIEKDLIVTKEIVEVIKKKCKGVKE